MAFAMAFTMMAGAAYTDQDDIQATDAVELLATLNVMTGKGDGMFHPNDTITRAEICRIIYTIRNEGNDNANAYADMQTSFQDLTSADDWAKGYIKHCQSVGLISGRNEAGTVFGPQDPVTGVELAVICLRVLGYDPAKAGIGGESWSTKTIGLASEAGLLKGVNMESVTGPCERQWAAQIMANMIDARTVRWSTDGDRYTNVGEDNTPNKTVGREYMKLHTTVGTLTSVSGSNLDVVCNTSDIADSDGALEKNFTNVKTDYSELLGQKVKVLYSDGKANSVIGVYALTGNTVYTVNASAVESDGDNKVKFDGKSYSIEYINTSTNNNGVTSTERENGIIRVLYVGINGNENTDSAFTPQHGVWGDNTDANKAYKPSAEKEWKNKSKANYFDAEDIFDDWNSSSAVMTFVDSDDNGRLDSVIITDYAAAEVTSVTSTKLVAGASYNFSDENIDEGLAQGDWVSISYNRFDDCKDIKKLEVTTGKLDGLKKDSKTKNYDADKKLGYLFDEYRVDSAWFNDSNNANADIKSVKAGDNIEYILLNGVAWKVKRSGAGSLDNVVDVAMVVSKKNDSLNGKQVKLQFFNDTTAVVDVDTYTAANNRVPFDAVGTNPGLEVGKLYEYSVSGGKYIFENLVPTKDFYGDYTYAGFATYETEDKEKIDAKIIDDTAKVIVFDGNDSDVITGKQLKNLAASTIDTRDNNAEYFTADVSGLNRAAAMTLKVKTLPQDLITNDHYGYILSDAVLSSGNNEISYDLLLESGETITVSEKSTKVDDRKANTLIGYKSLASEDSNGRRYIDDVTLYTLGSNGENKNFGIGAVTSVNSSQSAVEIWGYGKTEGWHSVNRDIPSDTVIFYVDTKDKEGSTTGTVRTAINWTSDLDKNASDFVEVTNIPGEDKAKVANCLYLCKDGEDMEVLVIEAGDRMFRGPEVDNCNKDSKLASLSLSNTTLSIAQDESKTIKVTTRNLVDKNISVSVKDASGNTPAGLKTELSANKIPDSGEVAITLNKDKSATVGKYTVTVTVGSGEDAKTATATVTVAGAAIGDVNSGGDNQLSFSTWTGSGSAAPTADLLPSYDFKADSIVSANANYTAAVKFEDANGKEITTALTEDNLKNLNVIITLTPKDGYSFADADSVAAPTLWGLTASKTKDSDGNIVLTYNYKKAASLGAGDMTGTAATDATKIERALAANGELELTTTLPVATVNVEKGQTLTLTTAQTDLSKLTGKGNVVLTGANASSVSQYIPSDKLNLGITTGTSADVTRGIGFSGTGTITAFSSKSVTDVAKETDSTTVTPVQLKLTTVQAPEHAFVKAVRVYTDANGVEKTIPMAGDLGTGFANDSNDLIVNTLLGDKITKIIITVYKKASMTSDLTADDIGTDGVTATPYTFNIK